jgi:hypothetical protein
VGAAFTDWKRALGALSPAGVESALPSGLDNRISSGRRISNDFPYNASPGWN